MKVLDRHSQNVGKDLRRGCPCPADRARLLVVPDRLHGNAGPFGQLGLGQTGGDVGRLQICFYFHLYK